MPQCPHRDSRWSSIDRDGDGRESGHHDPGRLEYHPDVPVRSYKYAWLVVDGPARYVVSSNQP